MEAEAASVEQHATGLLADIFAPEVATAQARCGGCGRVGPVGALPVYGGPMGGIVRCPDCDSVLIRVTLIRDTYRLDLRGTQSLLFPRGAIAARPVRDE